MADTNRSTLRAESEISEKCGSGSVSMIFFLDGLADGVEGTGGKGAAACVGVAGLPPGPAGGWLLLKHTQSI